MWEGRDREGQGEELKTLNVGGGGGRTERGEKLKAFKCREGEGRGRRGATGEGLIAPE